MKRILFITDIGSSWGGSEELWSKVALRLKNKGFKVMASLPWFGSEHQKVVALKNMGIEVYYRKNSYRDYIRKAARVKPNMFFKNVKSTIENQITKLKPDFVVFSQSHIFGSSEAMQYAAKKNIPYCSVTQLNSELSWPNDVNYKSFRKAFENAEMNYFVSQGNLDLLQTQLAFKLNKAKIIHNPFNFDMIPKLSWPSTETINFAFVGRLDFIHKGVDILLGSFSNKVWRDRDFNLNIYGSGNLDLAKELALHLKVPKINFIGHVDNIIDIWKENHALVLPSRYEGMPLSMIEAMYCKRVVVATDVAGHKEIISDGVTGFLAKAATIELFSEKLEEAWMQKDKWESIGINAEKNINDLFSDDPVSVLENDLIKIIS